jgi:hypothetical protein
MFAQSLGFDQRRVARVEVHETFALHGKQLLVAPEAARASGDFFSREGGGDEVVIVTDFERTETKLANVNRLNLINAAALAALETLNPTHDNSLRQTFFERDFNG